MSKPVIVITGASGLIGRSLTAVMAATNEVHGVSRQRRQASGASGVAWHALDLTVPGALVGLPERADAIIYLAQSELFRDFPERSGEIFQVNTVSLLKVLDYARKTNCRKFVFASSGGVYGAGDQPLSETMPVAPQRDLGFYLVSKLCSEMLVQAYAHLFETVILRYFFVYGAGQRRSMLIPRLIDRVRNGEAIALQGEDGVRINPTHVADAAAATARAVQVSGSHTINVAGPETLSMREIGEAIGKAVGREPRFSVTDSAPKHLVGDITRMRELLGPPRVRLAQGLQRMLESDHVR
jgi:nucleoside-diphosphate-sugar epimerase